eukprot:3257199-Prymnesium_polylepis.1
METSLRGSFEPMAACMCSAVRTISARFASSALVWAATRPSVGGDASGRCADCFDERSTKPSPLCGGWQSIKSGTATSATVQHNAVRPGWNATSKAHVAQADLL